MNYELLIWCLVALNIITCLVWQHKFNQIYGAYIVLLGTLEELLKEETEALKTAKDKLNNFFDELETKNE